MCICKLCQGHLFDNISLIIFKVSYMYIRVNYVCICEKVNVLFRDAVNNMQVHIHVGMPFPDTSIPLDTVACRYTRVR